jgi:hypothetical protein
VTRLIQKKDIPSSLWDSDKNILKLPPQLVAEWGRLLDKNNLREMAETVAPKGFEGGISKEDTDKHLAWRFTGSCARVILAMLDPKAELPDVADTFARVFAGNKVFLADLPCGSGAATISILTTLAELRKQARIPRMPLEIVILGGEISEFARIYTSEFLSALKIELENQAITIDFEIIHWDASDKILNKDLIEKLILKSQNCSEKLLIMANFSGFLVNSGKWKSCEDQFEEIFRFSLAPSSTAIWIEPNKNTVINSNGLMCQLVKFFKKQFSSLIQKEDISIEKDYETSTVEVKHPLKDHHFKTGLVVKRFNLSR